MSALFLAPSSLATAIARVNHSIPLEVLEEIVRQDHSPSSLARWCLVSRALVQCAGPLLLEDVSMTRPEHVLSFLWRLCVPRPPSPLRSLNAINPVPTLRNLQIMIPLPPQNTVYRKRDPDPLSEVYQKTLPRERRLAGPGRPPVVRPNPLSLALESPPNSTDPSDWVRARISTLKLNSAASYIVHLLQPAELEHRLSDGVVIHFSSPLLHAFLDESARQGPSSMATVYALCVSALTGERQVKRQAAKGRLLLSRWSRALERQGFSDRSDPFFTELEAVKDTLQTAEGIDWARYAVGKTHDLAIFLKDYRVVLDIQRSAVDADMTGMQSHLRRIIRSLGWTDPLVVRLLAENILIDA